MPRKPGLPGGRGLRAPSGRSLAPGPEDSRGTVPGTGWDGRPGAQAGRAAARSVFPEQTTVDGLG